MAEKTPVSLRRNIVFGLIGQGGMLLLSLIATRLVFKELGAEVLGVIGFAVTATSLLIFLADVGISPAVTREVAAHRENDPGYVRNLVRTASLLGWGGFFTTSIVAWLAAPAAADHWLRLEGLAPEPVADALRVISIALLLALPRAVYGALINGHHRVDWWNGANLWAAGVQQLGLIVVLAAGGGLSRIADWYAISACAGFLPFVFLAAKLSGWDSLLPMPCADVIRRNGAFSGRLFANSIANYVVTQVDRWTVSRLLPVSSLGYYGLAQGLVSKGAIVPGAIANASFPALSRSVVEAPREVWLSQVRKLQDLCGFAYVPTSAAVAMLGILVTRVVFDDAVACSMWFPLLLLSIGQMMGGLLTVLYWLAIAQRRPELAFRTNLWAMIAVVPLAVFLTAQFGLVGASAASIAYAAWQWIHFLPRVCRVCLGEHGADWYRRILPLPLIGFMTYGLSWFVAWLLGQGLSWPGLLGGFIVGSAAFLVLGWRVIGGETQRAFIDVIEQSLGMRIAKAS